MTAGDLTRPAGSVFDQLRKRLVGMRAVATRIRETGADGSDEALRQANGRLPLQARAAEQEHLPTLARTFDGIIGPSVGGPQRGF